MSSVQLTCFELPSSALGIKLSKREEEVDFFIGLRVLRTEEVITRRHRQDDWIQNKETHHWEWVTPSPATRLSTRLLWLANRSWPMGDRE